MTVRELGSELRARRISCVELIQRTLADVEARDTFRTLITVTGDEALQEARGLDAELAAGKDRGPFHGIPIAHKDLFYTRGIRTTAGSLVYKDFVPDTDAVVVERMRAAGAISIGKANLHEIAFGITSKNPHFGFVLNPHDPERIPGGSSGGSAALVGGKFLPVALGTDTGGSIRVPASYCGIAGIKPTYGVVSRQGVIPLSYSLDHIGPLGSCVEDCALAMNALADGEFNLPVTGDLKGVRIGVPRNFFFDRLAEDVAGAVRGAISQMQRLGGELVEIQVPDPVEMNAVARIVQLVETAAIYAKQNDSALFGADVWSLLEQGRMIAGHEYVNAQRLRTLFRRDFDAIWRKIDVLAFPSTPITAPRLNEMTIEIAGVEEDTRMATTRLVRSINLLGEPALSMPCGKGINGMPVGLQLVSAPFSDALLLRTATTLERALA